MNQNKKLLVPLPWLLLDLAGGLFILWSGLEYFQVIHLIPTSLRFPHIEMIMMVFGLLLMMPYQVKLMLTISKRLMEVKAAQQRK